MADGGYEQNYQARAQRRNDVAKRLQKARLLHEPENGKIYYRWHYSNLGIENFTHHELQIHKVEDTQSARNILEGTRTALPNELYLSKDPDDLYVHPKNPNLPPHRHTGLTPPATVTPPVAVTLPSAVAGKVKAPKSSSAADKGKGPKSGLAPDKGKAPKLGTVASKAKAPESGTTIEVVEKRLSVGDMGSVPNDATDIQLADIDLINIALWERSKIIERRNETIRNFESRLIRAANEPPVDEQGVVYVRWHFTDIASGNLALHMVDVRNTKAVRIELTRTRSRHPNELYCSINPNHLNVSKNNPSAPLRQGRIELILSSSISTAAPVTVSSATGGTPTPSVLTHHLPKHKVKSYHSPSHSLLAHHGPTTHHGSPHHGPTHHVSPGHVSPGHVSPGHVLPGHVSPGHVLPGHVSPGHLSPGHVSPHHLSPHHGQTHDAPSSDKSPPKKKSKSTGETGGVGATDPTTTTVSSSAPTQAMPNPLLNSEQDFLGQLNQLELPAPSHQQEKPPDDVSWFLEHLND